MAKSYRETIDELVRGLPLEIDFDVQMSGRPPSMASSEFLTNKEQGDWAESVIHQAINESVKDYCAVRYGRSEALSAGDPGFSEFYKTYQDELNRIGKRPDLLIFHRSEIPDPSNVSLDDDLVRRAVAAIEVRSSSFLANRYATYMNERVAAAQKQCAVLRKLVLEEPYSTALLEKNPQIHQLLSNASEATFRELDFRLSSWSSSPVLRTLSEYLKTLKSQIKTLHRRDYLSITPKLEDIALVNRWVRHYGVRHHYLQVFFDKAYVIPFRQILEICSDPAKEGAVFSVERDVKNQGKTTIKVNVEIGSEIVGKIEMPKHWSAMKELDRGRLLFYVTFAGGRGYLDVDLFEKEVIHEK